MHKLMSAFFATFSQALAIVDTLKMACELGFSHLIELDFLAIINKLNSGSMNFSIYGHTVWRPFIRSFDLIMKGCDLLQVSR